MDLIATLRELSQQQATGRLIVRFPGTLASIYLVAGDIVHATLGFNRGPEALAMTLQMPPLRCEFRTNLPAPEITIQISLESLLTVYAPGLGVGAEEIGTKEVATGEVAARGDPPSSSGVQHAPAEQLASAPQPPPEGDAVPTGFTEDLTRMLVYLMGPIGTIILEDAQADLNLGDAVPREKVRTLITEITRQLGAPARQQTFQREAAVLLARYNLS